MKKNIVIISCVFPPEPVVSANLSYDISTELGKNNNVVVLTPKPTRPFGFNFLGHVSTDAQKNFTHHYLNSFVFPKSQIFGRFYESYSFGIKARNYIVQNQKKIDVIYQNSWPLFAQFLIASAAKKFNIPLVTHVMDIYPERLIEKLPILKNFFYRLLLPIDKYILQNSSKVITISNDMFEEIVEKRKLKPENVSIVYNWINIEEKYDFESKKSDENFKFLYLGNIGPAAGLQNAIDAFSKFNNSPINLTIAGSGSEKDKLQAYVNRNQLKNIDFKEVPHGMVFKMQSNADVLLLPMQKGLGKVLLPSKFTSYLFSSKPILAITDKNCEIDKLINEFRCGWVIAHDEIDRLPNLIHEISIMPSEKLTEMGRNSFKLAQHFFSKNMNLQKICSDIMQCAHL